MTHATPRTRRRHTLLLLVTMLLVLAGCGSDGSGDATNIGSDGVSIGDGGPDELFAEIASFEVLANVSQRVMVGLSTTDGRVLHGGAVDLTFRPPDGSAAKQQTVNAPFLPLPASATPPSKPTIGLPSDGIGVYASTVTLETDGIWFLDVSVDGEKKSETAIQVLAKSLVPTVGSKAPATVHPIEGTVGVAPAIIDSRSGPNGLENEYADPLLHRFTIAELLAAKRPFLVVVSTPAFCQSKFCGPLTDLVDAKAQAKAGGEQMAYVHLEVWEDFANGKVNLWAREWLGTGENGREPWVFAVDATGTIVARYDNLLTEADLDDAIRLATAS